MLVDFLHVINDNIRPFGMEIKKGQGEHDGKISYGLVSFSFMFFCFFCFVSFFLTYFLLCHAPVYLLFCFFKPDISAGYSIGKKYCYWAGKHLQTLVKTSLVILGFSRTSSFLCIISLFMIEH